ncbi:MAG: restriction endonuclease subunit S [Clostridium beijerinckii]|nr:restriction endonuclease subunit S [Clostridium beijerinckii]
MNMMLEQFKTIFDRPEKVTKLREVILDLAVRGKLVEQDPNDEPASVLLERIREEKERLIKEGKIKKEKPLVEISEAEIPYGLPCGWEWVRLGNISETITKGSSPKWQGVNYIDDNNGVLFITSENVGKYKLLLNNRKYLEWKFNDIEPRSILKKNDLLINIVGGSIGRTAIFNLDECANINQAVCLVRTIEETININYLLYFMNSKVCINYMFENQVDNARANLSMSNISKFLIPMPSLEEQNRIVEKIDSLMFFCDELEKSLEKKVKYGSLSAKSVFNSIGIVNSIEELEECLRFIIANFKDLTLWDNAVKELKNAILQLAVQGKLVPQNPDEEPASVLLERMQEEKERLIKEKKIKKERPLGEISEEEKPFELPNGWEWIRIGDYCEINPRNNFDDNEDASFVPMKLINDGFDNKHSYEIKKWKEIKSGFTHFAENDVVIAKITPCFENRKSAVMKNLINELGAGTTELYVIRSINNSILPEYILSLCKTEAFIKGGVETYTGTAGQQRVKKDYIHNLVVALPPLAEQKRIVEKVDSLMQLCDELEKKIEQSNKYIKKLMESIIKEAVKA